MAHRRRGHVLGGSREQYGSQGVLREDRQDQFRRGRQELTIASGLVISLQWLGEDDSSPGCPFPLTFQ